MPDFIGRRVALGLGLESTPGTEVAPSLWTKHMRLNLQRRTNRTVDSSAMNRVERDNDSAVVEQWAEGTLEGKLFDHSIGFLLGNMYDSPVTTDNADTNPVVKDHTFNISQNAVAKTLTFALVDQNTNRRHGMGTLEGLELSCQQGGWVMVNAPIQAKAGVTAADTPAHVSENSFTSKHVTVKLASNTAGLGAASGLAIKSFRLNQVRETNKYFAMASLDPVSINTGAVSAEGEIVLKYDSTTLEDLWYANTIRAMSIAIVNTDVTIGAAARPGVVFTMPKVRLNTFDKSDDLDTVVEQTIGFTTELSLSEAYMIRPVLTNDRPSYP